MTQKEKDRHEKKRRALKILWALAFLQIASFPLLTAYWGFKTSEALAASGKPATIEALGQFGDSFGMITSLATVITLVLVAATTILQMQELALQRREMRESREAQEEQAAAAKEQAEITDLQVMVSSIDVERSIIMAQIKRLDEQKAYFANTGLSHQVERINNELSQMYSRLQEILTRMQTKIEASKMLRSGT